jgi:hypothetical protein
MPTTVLPTVSAVGVSDDLAVAWGNCGAAERTRTPMMHVVVASYRSGSLHCGPLFLQ